MPAFLPFLLALPLLFLLLLPKGTTSTPTPRPCRAGRFDNGKFCQKCPRGTYQSRPSSTSCLPCPSGTYNPYRGAQGLDVCKECPPETFGTVPGAKERSKCRKCPPGTNTNSGSSKCLSCAKGSFIAQCGKYPRDPLPTSFLLAFRGLCFQCYGVRSGIFCRPEGLGVVRPVCLPCVARTFNGVKNALKCEFCPEGKIALKGSEKCTRPNCPPGTEPLLDGQCAPCRSFSYNDGTFPSCQACPAGMRGNVAKRGVRCVPCPFGTFKGSKYETGCQKCKNGRNMFVRGGQHCAPDGTPCAPNFFRTNMGACVKCPLWQRYDRKLNKCADCPENSLSQGGISTICTPCPRGMRVNSGMERCSCKPGFGLLKGSNPPASFKCVKCSPGTQSFGDEYSCRPCRFDTFAAKPGMQFCTPCPEGSSQPLIGQTSCIQPPTSCPKGLINSTHAGCVLPASNCPPNYIREFSVEYELPICIPPSCPNGTRLVNPYGERGFRCGACTEEEYFSPGNKQCFACPIKMFSEGGFAKVCQKCPKGMDRFNGKCRCIAGSEMVDGECVLCAPGSSGFNSIEECSPCPSGTFSSGLSFGKCRYCRPGFFTDEQGQGECKPCPKGTISLGIGEIACVRQASLSK